MKYSELLGVLAAMTPDELDQEVVWWGDERGGKITSVFVLPENYATLDRVIRWSPSRLSRKKMMKRSSLLCPPGP